MGNDNNEAALFTLAEQYRGHPDVEVSLVDIRNYAEIASTLARIDTVLHCAAYKHLVLCEKSPQAAVSTNIISGALEHRVGRPVFTSSDKAWNPTNVMGTSKLMGERLVTAASAQKTAGDSIPASTRFGNVLGSNGSVMPVFAAQIAREGPLTLTSHDMTRFVMTLEEAVDLELRSAFLACVGEVFVTNPSKVASAAPEVACNSANVAPMTP